MLAPVKSFHFLYSHEVSLGMTSEGLVSGGMMQSRGVRMSVWVKTGWVSLLH